MGKVLSNFLNGYAGAIARSLDDVVVTLANRSGAALPFGVPVGFSADHGGIVRFDPASHTGNDFIGVTVRNPSKTPDTYGGNTGSYADKELVDVLVRGKIVVKMAGSGAVPGTKVNILNSTGGFTVAYGDTAIPLNNVHISCAPDGAGMAEIVLNTRNLI